MTARTLRTVVANTLVALLLGASQVHAHDSAQVAQNQVEPSGRAASVPETRSTLIGTVRELTVDDTTRATSARYLQIEEDDGTLAPLQGTVAARLAADARVEISGRRNGKAFAVETARSITSTPNARATAVIDIEGTFQVAHADDFVRGRSTYIYEVHQSSGRINRLRLGFLPPALAPGSRVRASGHVEADGETLTPDRITILTRPASTSSLAGERVAQAVTANKVLLIMANFSNTATPALTTSQAMQMMSTNSDSVANFFQEASYGQQVMNVTVTGWVTMGRAQPGSCGTSDWQGIGSSAEAAAKALGSAYDPATYNYVVYVFPAVPSCGWAGLAYIGTPHKSWINGIGALQTQVVAHEMGHNFGLLHAASLNCGAAVIGGACSASEYGDPFDTMGNQRAMHYNAMQKSKLAWIPSSSVRTHSSGSATYTLSPIEIGGGATYAVTIPTGSPNRSYWIEFRQPIGFDSPLAAFPNNGAQIRVGSPFETYCGGCDGWSDDTELLDMAPGTSTFTDATLGVGQTFSDATYGVNVTVLSASASAMTVQVATGGATLTSTSTTLGASPNPAVTGATVAFSASVSGNAPTGTVRFTDNGSVIDGCDAVTLAASSATCTTNALVTGLHAIVASYSGDSNNLPSTSGTLTATINAPVNGTNVALASNGATASASSTHSAGYDARYAIDNRRDGAPWGNGGGWNDGTGGAWPDWLQINFAATKTIDHVVVYSLQDNYPSPVEPTDSMTFSLYGITAFDVQGWNGASWVTLASVTSNNLVKRVVSFSPYSTDRIRIVVNAALNTWSRITEVEAWSSSSAPAQNNVALASAGATASASSTHDAGYAPSFMIDNQRTGAPWGNGGGWNDATSGAWPDWVQIDFGATRTIDHVVLYSLQDNFTSPVEPTDTMTFSVYGITAFDVQGWNGSGWVTLASVTGNNLVKRTVWFTGYTTPRIRINVNAALRNWSRITEIEAWGY